MAICEVRKVYMRIIVTLLLALTLTSCDNSHNPIDASKNGASTTTVYQYIVPAVGNIQFSTENSYASNNTNSVTNWGGWISVPIGETGAYVAQEGDTVTFQIISSDTGNFIPGVQGTVFTSSAMGVVNVKPDGKLYYAPSLYKEAISSTQNCFSPLDWGAVIPTVSQPCVTAQNTVCQNTGSGSCMVNASSASCTPIGYPVLTPTGNFGLPASYPNPVSNVMPQYPLKVYGAGGSTAGAPGDFYIFFVNGSATSTSNSVILPQFASATSPCLYDATGCFDYDCATAAQACSASGAAQSSVNCSQLSSICGNSNSGAGATSGSGSRASCVTASTPANCYLANGQGLDILTCDDLEGSNCQSLRSGQLMSPFISLSDYFGNKNTFAPQTDGQVENTVPVPFDVMLAQGLNNSTYLYPRDMVPQDKNQALSSNVASNYIQNFKSFSVMFGSNIPPAQNDTSSNSFSGGSYLAFKIDPEVINQGGGAPGGGYSIGYYGYSPKDAVNNGSTYPYSGGDLVFTFADSNHIPSANNPERGNCSTTAANGICSYSQAPQATYTPVPGTSLYLRVADTIAPNNETDGCYMDNYGYYLVNITVTNTKQANYGWFQKISSYVITFVVSTLKGAVALFYSSIVNNADFKSIVRLMTTLYISLYAAYFVIGLAQVNATEVLKRVLKISLLMVLISPQSFHFYNEYLFGILTQGFMQIVQFAMKGTTPGTVVGADQAVANVFGFVDDIINVFFAPSIWLRLLVVSGSVYTLFIIPMFIYAMFTYFKVVVEAFVGYLVMLTSIYLMIGMFPLFAIMLLFDYTRKYFWGWLNYTLNFCLQPIIFLISFMLLNSLIMIYLNTFISFKIEWGCWLPIYINITSLVGPLALFLPTIKVYIACIPWYIIGSPITVVVNAVTLLLLIKSVKSMLDFAPIVAERLMSSGFGADSGGVQVAPGAIPGMTGGGHSGFGRDASLAKQAYEGSRDGIKGMFYDKNLPNKSDSAPKPNIKGGAVPLNRDKVTTAADVAKGGGIDGANSGGGGFRPSSVLTNSSMASLPGANNTQGSGLSATNAGASRGSAAPAGNLAMPVSTPPSLAQQGASSMAANVSPSTKPLSTRDAVAQAAQQLQAGSGTSAIDAIRSRGRDLTAERADRAASISGSGGVGLPSGTSSADAVRARGEAVARPGSQGLPTGADVALPVAHRTIVNPLHQGKSIEAFKASKALPGITARPVRADADATIDRSTVTAPLTRGMPEESRMAQAAGIADSLVRQVCEEATDRSAPISQEYGAVVTQKLEQIRNDHFRIQEIAEASQGSESNADAVSQDLASRYLSGHQFTAQDLEGYNNHVRDMETAYNGIKESMDQAKASNSSLTYDDEAGTCNVPGYEQQISEMHSLKKQMNSQKEILGLIGNIQEHKAQVRDTINETMATGGTHDDHE